MSVSEIGSSGLRSSALLAACFALAASCKDPPAQPAGPSPSASASAADSASARPRDPRDAGELAEERGAIRPVYPIDDKPILPLAEEYCNAVRGTPKRRREECCPGAPSFVMLGECARTLSSALRSGAITLERADMDACAAAVAKETAGCDWVTSVGSPTVAACLGVLKGTLKEGATCRSAMECADGMTCFGLGATRPGKCTPPLPRGACNLAIDTLATHTGQDDLERRHPSCAGYCGARRCMDPVGPGGACKASLECGPKAWCVAGKCAEGPPPAAGKPCTDACAPGARCIKGSCVLAKAGGERCDSDLECRGHCSRDDGGTSGRCGPECPSFSFSKPAK